MLGDLPKWMASQAARAQASWMLCQPVDKHVSKRELGAIHAYFSQMRMQWYNKKNNETAIRQYEYHDRMTCGNYITNHKSRHHLAVQNHPSTAASSPCRANKCSGAYLGRLSLTTFTIASTVSLATSVRLARLGWLVLVSCLLGGRFGG